MALKGNTKASASTALMRMDAYMPGRRIPSGLGRSISALRFLLDESRAHEMRDTLHENSFPGSA